MFSRVSFGSTLYKCISYHSRTLYSKTSFHSRFHSHRWYGGRSSLLGWSILGATATYLFFHFSDQQSLSAHAYTLRHPKEIAVQIHEESDVHRHLIETEIAHLPIETAIITTAPEVPPAITRHHPVLLKVQLDTTTKTIALTNRYKYNAWTYNDTVPGPMIRARVGDIVQVSLTNRDESGNPHNIDCHAFEGPGGGGTVTFAQEGETKVARFRCLYPGLYVYHCAAAPVPSHIMNGMYGLMLVEPEYTTLPAVDKEFYVMQSEFYVEPLEKGQTIAEPSYPNGLKEDADVVVFNGSETALRDKPLKAKTGDRVRFYFGNAGPNLTSAFHVIGGIFEKVYRDGDLLSPPGRFIQTLCVPPGGVSVVDMTMLVPGTYTLVDHAIFRIEKGAVGYLNVTGEQRPDIYMGFQQQQACPDCKLHP